MISLWFLLFSSSGTLSYLFNNFVGDRSFSEVVAEAKNAGFTEPDPRDDLSGTDVARKVHYHFYLSNNSDSKVLQLMIVFLMEPKLFCLCRL